MSSIWANKARGKSIGHNKVLSVDEIKKYDFVIASSGGGLHYNIQNAYDARIPCIYTFNGDPKAKADQTALDPDSWKAERGVSGDLDLAVADLFVGGWALTKMRVVHGILLDVNFYDETRKVNGAWFKGYYDWLLEKLEDLTGLDNKDGYFRKFVYAKYSLLEGSNAIYSGSDKETVQSFFYQSQKNISTLSTCSVDEDGLPTAASPTLPYNDSSSCPWKFWLYHLDDDGCYDVISSYTKDQLYEVLGFTETSSGTSTGSGSDDPVVTDPVVSGDLETRKVVALERIADALESMADGEEFAATVKLWNIPS